MSNQFQAANALHQQGKLDEAAAAYEQISQDDADYYKAQNNLGLILQGRGRLGEAERAFRNALAQKGDSAILHYNLGRALHQSLRLLDAWASYQKAMALDPEWAEPVYNAAIVCHQQDRHASAETLYRKALEMAPAMAAAHRHLGDLLFETRRHAEALAHYERALELDPEHPSAWFNLGKTLFLFGRLEEAEAAYRRSLAIQPQSNAAWSNLVELLRRAVSAERAQEAVREWLSTDPDNPIARHTWAALAGETAPDRASDAYVSQLFDDFAPDFEATLSQLQYQAPRLAAEALWAAVPPDAAGLTILDAGCGTGLCGPYLRQRAARLSGVDLSRGMLERAHLRGIYDELAQEDLVAHLRDRPGMFDAIVAADTLNYFGALDEVFAAAAGALRPQGVLVFTLERDDGSPPADWRLHAHGRYSHTSDYVGRALRQAGLTLRSLDDCELRQEGGGPARGWIAVAHRGD